ncbi:MAG: DNA translocase FtsK [Eubacteriales bacterium]
MANTKKKKNDDKTGSKQKTGGKRLANEPKVSLFRRELAGLICFFLGLFCLFSFFTQDAWFILIFSNSIKGLVGVGFIPYIPTFFLASFILLCHRGRPVVFRVVSALLVPFFLSCMAYGFLLKDNRPDLTDVVTLWNNGKALSGSGVLGSIVGGLFTIAITGVGTIILFFLCSFLLFLAALNRSVMDLIDWYAARPRYEEPVETIEPEVKKPTKVKKQKKIQEPPPESPPILAKDLAEQVEEALAQEEKKEKPPEEAPQEKKLRLPFDFPKKAERKVIPPVPVIEPLPTVEPLKFPEETSKRAEEGKALPTPHLVTNNSPQKIDNAVFTAWEDLKVKPSAVSVPDPLSAKEGRKDAFANPVKEFEKPPDQSFFKKEKAVPTPDQILFPQNNKEQALPLVPQQVPMTPAPVIEQSPPSPLVTLPVAEFPSPSGDPKTLRSTEIRIADDPSMTTLPPTVEASLPTEASPTPQDHFQASSIEFQTPVVPAPFPPSGTQGSSRIEPLSVESPSLHTPPITQEQIQTATEPSLKKQSLQYIPPPLSLLKQGSAVDNHAQQEELSANRLRLEDTLNSFSINAKIHDVTQGPSVTRYEVMLEQGVKLSKIVNLSDDIALALGATGVRIAPIPDKISMVGIEVPNKTVTPVEISTVLGSANFFNSESKVSFAVGKDISGHAIVGNIGKMPHLLVAGTTGSGKSVCTNSLIVSLLYKASPEEVRLIMIDPKMVELQIYNGIPHLLIPVVTDPKKAAGALQWAVTEMMKRYRLFSEVGTRDLASYNQLAETREDMEKMPQVVVVIDELADLMLVAAKEVEESICRVAQMGRASGMHLIVATQRPSADVITGLMKANIPSRISFAVSSGMESRIILDTQGAEKLVGRGDMLYAPLGEGKPTRVQGCLISDAEVSAVVGFVKEHNTMASYSDEIMEEIDQNVAAKEKKNTNAQASFDDENQDEMLDSAVEVVLDVKQASTSMIQRRLKLGYARAARIVDQMEDLGVVGPSEGSKPRQILITKEQWQELKYRRGSSSAAPPPQEEDGHFQNAPWGKEGDFHD